MNPFPHRSRRREEAQISPGRARSPLRVADSGNLKLKVSNLLQKKALRRTGHNL
jgi:hypothetical protein